MVVKEMTGPLEMTEMLPGERRKKRRPGGLLFRCLTKAIVY
jgi:hypothetical protein